jgi:hypothetical protein
VAWDNHHKFKTHKGTVKNAMPVQWKDTFEFNYETRRLGAVGKELRLDVIQKNLTGHSKIGSVKIPLVNVLNGPQHFNLNLKEGSRLGGKIRSVCCDLVLPPPHFSR